MAVYTELKRSEAEAFAESYGIGPVRRIEPILQGIENTNYRIWAGAPGAEQPYVLTLFERVPRDKALSTAGLALALARRGVPTVRPLSGSEGLLGTLRGKPARLTRFVRGKVVWLPSSAHLEALGHALAELHRAGADLAFTPRGAHTVRVLAPLAEHLAQRVAETDPETADLLNSEAEFQRREGEPSLPEGVIHADLFLDNVLFDDEEPTVRAILDLDLADRGPWIYDVAVVLCDAGWVGSGISGERARALLGGYRSVRAPETREYTALPALLRRAALRFLCFRLQCTLDAPVAAGPGLLAPTKDPGEFAARLRALRRETT